MTNYTHKRSALAIAVLTALSCNFASAQEDTGDKEEAENLEVIQVSGIRASVIKAMDIKRESNGVMDAISAEDIGKFPDSNLAESLQRITGVSIDRKNNEGNQVSVRGFGPSFNMVTLNGRQMPAGATQKQENDSSAEQSRAFNFAEIAAESVAGVEVYKTSKAHITSGGIGATVNLITAKPLSFEGTKFSGSIKGVADQSVETGDSITPEISGLFTTQNDNGTLGVVVTASHSERHNRENFVATDGWLRVGDANVDTSAVDRSLNPTGQIWMPRNVVVDQSDHERERTNAHVAIQFRPSENFQATIDYTISDYEDSVERSQVGVWIESPNPIGIADSNGSVTQVTIPNLPQFGLGAVDWQGYSDTSKTENRSVGLNLEWQATESIELEFDYHDSYSDAQPGAEISDFLVIISGPLGTQIDANFGDGDTPTLSIDDSGTNAVYGDAVSGYLDPAGIRPNIDLARNKSVRNDITQAQLHGTWTNLGDGALSNIKFGVAQTDYEIKTGWLFDLGVQAQPNCGINGNDVFGNPTCSNLASALTLENTHFPNVFPSMLTFNARDVFNDTVNNMGSVFDLLFTNTNIITEETSSVYASMQFDTEFNGMPIELVAGVRYESTDVTGTTLQVSPEAMVYVSTTEFRPNFTSEEVEYTLNSDYDVFLPSLDFSIELQDDLIARASYGRSITRSDLNSMKPSLSIVDARPGGPYNAAQGNPGLKPYTSDNIDLAIEWYYAEGSYMAFNYFKKWVDNYVVSTISQGTIMGALGYELTDPNPQDDPNFPTQTVGGPDDQVITWDILSFDNGEDAEVDGIELAVQHLFGETGFGAQANVTFVDGDVEYDIRSLNQDVSLTGLSDSANLVAFYEKDGIQVRIAYNWRDKFLLSKNQLRQANEPVFVDDYGQWDINASYDLTDNLTLFVEGINLTGEDAKSHGRFENQFIYFADQEARYTFGVRGSF